MSNQTPLNPDALEAGAKAMYETRSLPGDWSWEELRGDQEFYRDIAQSAVSAYLAVAQPEVNSAEELDKLPYGSLIIGSSGVTVMKYDGPNYDWITGSDYRYRMEEQEQCLPARVLYRPVVES